MPRYFLDAHVILAMACDCQRPMAAGVPMGVYGGGAVFPGVRKKDLVGDIVTHMVSSCS